MTLDQRNALINLLVQVEEIVAENEALRALLDVVEKHGPWQNTTWREQLDHLMKSPAREKYREMFAPALQEIDSAFHDSELSQLLLRMPTKGRPN